MQVTLDWDAPWYGPWRARGFLIGRDISHGSPVHEALNRHAPPAVRFVPPEAVAAGRAYEQHVFDSGSCPTRDNLHDFFNGLVWLELPMAKQQLNRLHVAQIAANGIAGQRGAVRDAATLFDENGAVLTAPEALWDALAMRDWRRLFVDLRPLWSQARLLVFGHALLEKLASPRKNLTAHVWGSCCPGATTADVDSWLAGQLTAQRLAAKPFVPLPVMGIPGWCPASDDFSFYDDPQVFRP